MPLVDALDIDAAFSPRLITAEAILRFVHGRALKAMHLLRGGAEVLEIEVDHGCPAAGRTVAATRPLAAPAWSRSSAGTGPGPPGGRDVRDGDRVLILGTRRRVADVEPAFNAA